MILKTHIHLFIITHEILQNLKDKNILQTFIDSTYRHIDALHKHLEIINF